MKTKVYVFILFFMTGLSIISADQSEDVFFTVASAKNLDQNIRSNSSNGNVDLSDIKGSPYEHEAFMPGKAVSKKLNNSKPCLLRYNIYNDIIEIKDNGNPVGLIKSLSIYAVINDIEYHYKDFIDENNKASEGYFILLSRGAIINLYLRKTKTFNEAVKAESSYSKDKPAAFVDSQSYYFKKHDVLLPFPHKKKELFKLFPEYEPELNRYLKEEKINPKSEEDIKKLFSYLDTVLK